MNSAGRWIAIFCIAAACAGAGFWFGARHRAAAADPDEPATTEPAEEKAVVDVTVAPLEMRAIKETITAYGVVAAQASDVRVISVPFESRVTKVLVTAGQQITAGTEIVEVEPSPDAKVSLQEAKNAVAAAARDLGVTQQRFNAHLATNTDLSQAQAADESAKLKLSSLTQNGVGEAQTLKSKVAGIVSKINVEEGQIVPSGGALVEIAGGNKFEVVLGVEPNDAADLKPGQAVELTLADRSTDPPIVGKIRLIGQRLDPAARLATVTVALPPDTHWLLDAYVLGKISKSAANGLIVPRAAVLPDDDAYALFTVKNDKAVKHTVKLGLENDRETQVIADDLKAGDSVVILGNFELEDGMSVTAKPAPPPPATAPATTEAAQ